MTDRSWRPAHKVALAAIMLIGFAVRVAFVAVRQSKVVLQTGDAYWYHYQARLVADGAGSSTRSRSTRTALSRRVPITHPASSSCSPRPTSSASTPRRASAT